MTNNTPKLSDQQTLNHARTTLETHLPLEANGYKCTSETLYDVLLAVTVTGQTVTAVCADLVGTPDPETVRHYLMEQLTVEDLPLLQQRLNQALAESIAPRLYRKAHDVAIDFHDRSYYGKAPQEEALWVRGKAKDGTTRFYRVATAYVVRNGLRLTLAMCFVLPQADTVAVLDGLLNRLKALNLPISCLLLDKGFASIETMRYLSTRQMPAIIACPIRGKSGGTRALCTGQKSYRTRYSFQNNKTSQTAELAVCRSFTTAKRTGRMQRRATWLIFILIEVELSPRQVRRRYRKRFGIETSYRCAAQVRGRTTSPNAAYRFVLLALSFVMLNVWVHLCWLYTQVARRGSRWLDVKRFPLRRFARFIVRALEQKYGYPRELVAPSVPLP